MAIDFVKNFFIGKKQIGGLGAVPEKPDKRDFVLEEIMGAPQPVDWNRGYDIEEVMGRELPSKNQGQSSSCVGQAWSYYSEVLEYLETRHFRRQSARFIYSQIYLPSGGAYLRDGGQILTNQGEVPEPLVPDYKTEAEMRYKDDITPDIKEMAKVYLKGNYALIQAVSIDTLASIIQQNYGFVAGVADDFRPENWTKEIVKPGSRREEGHALYFGKFKLINGKKYVGAKNSWGDKVGKKGWQWFGEEWLKLGRFFNPRTIINLENIVERPKKKPKAYFLHNLGAGMKSPEVAKLQECLAYLGLFNYPQFTGYFGGITLKGVKAFQILHGIPATGFVGPMTRNKLNEIFGK